ncbi:MAG: hypothetical protein FD167_407 [bacterium]|nr:MAG: hypothetical protein FD167_407 [bacterium]
MQPFFIKISVQNYGILALFVFEMVNEGFELDEVVIAIRHEPETGKLMKSQVVVNKKVCLFKSWSCC